MAANTINYQRNTTYTITHTYQKNGVDSSDGTKLFFTAKTAQYDSDSSDSAAIVSKTITMSGATTTFTINPPDVSDAIPPGNYYWDIKIQETTGPPIVQYQGAFGAFNLLAEPTNRES